VAAAQGVLQLSPYGRLASFLLGFGRSGAATSLLSNGRLVAAGGRRITGLFGTIYYGSGEFLGVGNELVYSTPTLGYPDVPVDGTLAPLPGGKALLLGGSHHQQAGGVYINGPYAPWIVDPLAAELSSSVEGLPAGARDDCGGESARFQGTVVIEPFGGSIATNQMGAAGAQWKIAVLKTGSNYLWIYDTAQKAFQCHGFANLTHLDEVRMAALSNGSLFIWKGNDSKVFDPSANGGAGALSDITDPSQAIRTQAGVVGIGGGKVVVVGGLSAPAAELDTIEVYDSSSNQWTTANARLRTGKYRLFPRFDRVTGHVVLLGGHRLSGSDSVVELGIDAWDPLQDRVVDTGLELSLDPWLDFTVPYTGGFGNSGVRRLDYMIPAPSAISGSIYWVGDKAQGDTKVSGYESGLAPRLYLNTPWERRPYTVQVLSGSVTPVGQAPYDSIELEMPLETQADIRVRVTAADGGTGEFSFSTSVQSGAAAESD